MAKRSWPYGHTAIRCDLVGIHYQVCAAVVWCRCSFGELFRKVLVVAKMDLHHEDQKRLERREPGFCHVFSWLHGQRYVGEITQRKDFVHGRCSDAGTQVGKCGGSRS